MASDPNDRFNVDSHKAMFHPQRVAQWLGAGDDVDKLIRVYPLYVEISPVGQCDARCIFCSVEYLGYKLRSLPEEPLCRALTDMAAHGIKSVMFAGEGEPLLHQQIAKIVSYTKACGIDVAFTTNATHLTPELSEEMLGGVTWLKASINGGTPEAYAAVHRVKPQLFARVIANLAAAVKVRDRHGWKTTLGSQTVLIPETLGSVVELARISREIGLNYCVVKPYSQNPNSTGTAGKGFDEFDYQATADLAAELREFNTPTFKVVYRERTMANLAEPERGYKVCHATPMTWAYLMSNGTVSACSAHLLDPRFELGNINDQTFSEIWEGEKRRKLIETMRSFDVSVCRKNCRMQHVNIFLDRLRSPDPHDAFI